VKAASSTQNTQELSLGL